MPGWLFALLGRCEGFVDGFDARFGGGFGGDQVKGLLVDGFGLRELEVVGGDEDEL